MKKKVQAKEEPLVQEYNEKKEEKELMINRRTLVTLVVS